MNTILTDDERNQIIDSMGWSLDGQERGDMHRLIEAVLAKLREQEPVVQVEVVVPHLRSVVVKHIHGAPLPNVGDQLYAAPLPAVVQVPLTDDAIEQIAVKHEAFGFGQVDAKGFTTHGFDPDGLRAFVREILAAPEAPAQGEQNCRWCDACGEGVTTFCRGKTDACPMFKKAPAQPSVPAPWREAVKVARANFRCLLSYVERAANGKDVAWPDLMADVGQECHASIAQLDALEGGE